MKLSQLFLFLGVFWVYAYGRLGLRRIGLKTWELALAVGFLVLLVLQGWVANQLWLTNFNAFPPPFTLFFLYIWIFPLALGLSRFGREIAERSSFRFLIGFHAFRILAEATIHFGWEEGFAPIQLSLHGYNFDILTGVGACIFLIWPKAATHRSWIWAWNVLGIAALLNIGFIAMTSMPTPLRLFMSEPDNRWVAYFPYIFLPGILVVAAVFGHVLITRKLLKP